VYILNLETSTKNCSVSIAKDGQTLICKEIAETGFSHAERLHVFIEEVLAETKLNFNDLAAIAVSQGPGSYTGLRIGVSAAKGLCYALNLPLIAVDTLQSLANQVVVNQGYIVPMIDARRMEVYSAIFDHNHQKTREIQAQIIDENSFSDITENIYIVGDCNEKIKTVLTKNNIIFIDTICYPSANQMSEMSYQKFKNQDFENLAYFEPFYLKDFLITTKKP
jgi:tRNA threonylcarbamoyladenosine biosynthesis protein TsaB